MNERVRDIARLLARRAHIRDHEPYGLPMRAIRVGRAGAAGAAMCLAADPPLPCRELGDGREAFATHMRRMETAIDHYQDPIDGFWGEAQGFAYLVNNPRTRNQVLDMFAGRIYDVTERDIPAIKEMRALARKAREGGRLQGEDRRRSGFVAPTA